MIPSSAPGIGHGHRCRELVDLGHGRALVEGDRRAGLVGARCAVPGDFVGGLTQPVGTEAVGGQPALQVPGTREAGSRGHPFEARLRSLGRASAGTRRHPAAHPVCHSCAIRRCFPCSGAYVRRSPRSTRGRIRCSASSWQGTCSAATDSGLFARPAAMLCQLQAEFTCEPQSRWCLCV